MNRQSFERFQEGAADAGVIYYYSGCFDSAMMQSISSALKEKLERENASGPVKRKLFSSFVEMAQNVLHYGGAPADGCCPDAGKPGAIGMGQTEESYWIACGNLVPSEHVERINSKLAAIMNMSLAEIKAAYREQLANDEHESTDAVSKGAGLGLLTIARDSTRPLEFEFTPHPLTAGRFSYFYLKTVI